MASFRAMFRQPKPRVPRQPCPHGVKPKRACESCRPPAKVRMVCPHGMARTRCRECKTEYHREYGRKIRRKFCPLGHERVFISVTPKRQLLRCLICWPAQPKGRTRAEYLESLNPVGKRFGKLVLVQRLGGGKWELRCDCGRVVVKWSQDAISGGTKSCGCLRLAYYQRKRRP